MKWSVQTSVKRFVLTQYRSLSVFWHVYYLVLAAIFGFAWGGQTVFGWLVRAAVFYIILWLLFIFLCARRYKRIVRLTGSRETGYELSVTEVVVKIGKDKVSLPLDQLSIRKIGSDYIVLKRQNTRLGTLVLQFDDAETLAMAKTWLESYRTVSK